MVNSAGARLPAATVQRMSVSLAGMGDGGPGLEVHRVVYGATGLLYLPRHVGVEVLKRPANFIRAVKLYCQPELF